MASPFGPENSGQTALSLNPRPSTLLLVLSVAAKQVLKARSDGGNWDFDPGIPAWIYVRRRYLQAGLSHGYRKNKTRGSENGIDAEPAKDLQGNTGAR